jgi:membrane-bound lytic murein transglycosylase B
MGAPMSNFLSNGYLTQQVTNDLVFGSKGKHNGAAVKSNHITVQRAAPVMPKKLAAGYPANARAEAERVFAKLLELYAQVEKQYGVPANDLGGVVGLFLVASYEAYQTPASTTRSRSRPTCGRRPRVI